MAKQLLGKRKGLQVARLVGKNIVAAYTSNNYDHYWCEAWVSEAEAYWVNYKTGEVRAYFRDAKLVAPDIVRKADRLGRKQKKYKKKAEITIF